MIKFSNIEKKFGQVTAVNIDNLTISKGEIVGLIGNNGAGKTTLFNMTLDLLKPDAGIIRSKGLEIACTDNWKSYTSSYLNEKFLIGYLTPKEYFELVAYMYKMTKDQLSENIEMFKDFMNGEIMGNNKLIRQLSSGNRQKVGIIGAFLPDSEFIIFDEPFNYLDPRSQIIFKEIVKKVNQLRNTTFFISSHNLNHVSEICSRILLMEKGNIILDQENNVIDIKKIDSYFSVKI